jgi:hypothetical protein
MVDFGTDFNSQWIANSQGDFLTITGLDNAEQAIYNRLITRLDELIQLNYDNYGNRSYEVLGSTDILNASAEIKIYTTNCLLAEPRVQEIKNIDVDFNGSSTTIHADVMLIGEDKPTNMVINIGETL